MAVPHEEVVESLDKLADIGNFTRDITQYKFISQDVKKSFDSLDPSVPRPLQIRYLLLHAYQRLEKGNSKLRERWLRLLAKYGVPSQLVQSIMEAQSLTGSDSSVEQHDSLVSEDGDTNVSIGKKRPSGGYFLERHISDLTEVLAGYSGQWKNIAISLSLPAAVRDNIMARIHMHNNKVCLSEVLREWIIGGHEYALPPSMENLKKALGSEQVGLGKVAGQLEKNLSKRGVCILSCGDLSPAAKRPCLDDTISTQPLVEIVYHSLDTVVPEEKSTLLEVQVDCEPFHTLSYQWIKDGGPLHNDTHYGGTNEQILCIKNASLISKGTYSCKVEVITCSDQPLAIESDPIVLTVEIPHIKKFLVDMYCNQPVVNEASWQRSKDRISYSNLALIKMEKIDPSNEYARSTIQGDMDDVECEKESISYEEAFGAHRSGALVLIEGRPGSGKTTLVHKISNDWATGKRVLVGAKLLFLVSLRVLSKMDGIIGMADILQLFYHNEALAHDSLEHIQNCNGEGVCFILDGLDEYSEKDSESVIFQLINKRFLHLSMVIVASRPIATAELRKKCDKRLEALGFLKEEIDKYVYNYPFCGATSSAESLKSFLSEHPNILHMCYLPVHAAMVCFLHDRMRGSLPHTETGMYKHFVRLTLQRNANHNCSEKPWSIDSLPKCTKKNFNNICKLAFDMTISHEQVFSEKSLSPSDDISIDDPAQGLVTIDFMADQYGLQKLYAFAHLTLQEYLAAYHIASLDEEKQMEVMSEYGKEGHMQVIWKFFCGLTSFKDQDPKFSKVCEFSHKLSFHCQCAFESQHPTTCTSVVLKHDGVFNFRWCTLKPSDLACIGYVISNADSFVSELKLHSCDISDDASLIACADMLKMCSYLQLLDLSSNKIGSNNMVDLRNHDHIGIVRLCSAITNCVELIHLDLENNQVGCYEARILGSHLRTCAKLSILNFNENVISDDGMKGLAEGLKACVELKKLFLDANQINDYGAKSLGSVLSTCVELHQLHLKKNQIGDDGVKGLAKGLKTCVELHQLHLEYNQIGDDGAKGLAECLRTCVELSYLYLNNNQIGCNGAESLGSALSTCVELIELHLEYNQIGDDGAKSLAKGLRTCVKLSSLHLDGNQIGDDGAKDLAETLKTCVELHQLHLGDNQIGDDGAKGLAESLRTCVELRSLYLNNNQIGCNGAESLGSALSTCVELDELHLEDNQIGDNGAKGLAKGLRTCVKLSSLNLGGNQIGDDGAKGLAEGLKTCVELDELHLEYNQIGDDGAKGLAEGLRTCIELSSLYLDNNQIGCNGAESLGLVLSTCVELDELYLEYNKIGDDGAKGLAKGLRTCVKLDLDGNQIGDDGAKGLAEGLRTCVELYQLHLGDNQIGDDGAKGLAEGLRTCIELSSLYLDNNQIGCKGAESLGSALSTFVEFDELHLQYNKIGDDGAKGLAKGLTTCVELSYLYLNNNQIGCDGAESLGSALSTCVELEELHLEFNEICDDGAKGLAKGLRTCVKLSSLYLNNNQICCNGAESLGSALSTCVGLHQLHLGDNQIGDNGAKSLAKCLRTCVKLSSLHLDGNQIGDDGAKGLAEGLKTCVKLSYLYLNNNQIGCSGAESLGSALSTCVELHQLHLGDNQIGDNGAKSLAKGLRTCVELSSLYLNNNQIGCNGAESLGSALSTCVELDELHLQIGDDGSKGL